ncbi:MAG: YicC/YloC family endoribonuclease [Puniceicoccaceae bacterium]
MTGFGRAQATIDGMDLSVEISSVNRRNLEISVSLPRDWQALERDIQAAARENLNRGKLHIYVQAMPAAGEGGFHWDAEGLESSMKRLEQVAQAHGIAWPPDANALVRIAGLNKVEMALPGSEEIAPKLIELVQTALQQLVSMRETEGLALKEDLSERNAAIGNALAQIREKSENTVGRFREMLLQRLNQSGLELDISDERVLKEVAIYADKCDISEEQTRLDSHLQQFAECLQSGSPVGRKLEFILQEVNREFNTIGSKAGNVDVSRFVIEAKNEIERIREQIQNIE